MLLAVHDHDGGWQMLCGGDEHVVKEECAVLHKEHLAERDPTLAEVFDLPRGWEAERESVDAPWNRAAFVDEDD